MTVQKIYLVGFSYTGKTTIGRLLAKQLGWLFYDLDEMIVKFHKKSIPEIFNNEGEKKFRLLETNALKRISKDKNIVVATGGGAITQKNNREIMQNGFTVCLEAKPKTILTRSKNSLETKRPLLEINQKNSEVKIKTLKKERQFFYSLSDCTVHTDSLEPEKIANEIERLLDVYTPIIQQSNNTIPVRHKHGSYNIDVVSNNIPRLINKLQSMNHSKIFIITDTNVWNALGKKIQNAFDSANIPFHLFEVKPGEKTKNLQTVEYLYDGLIKAQAERNDTLIAFGGGVIGDLAGFVAATFMRGIRFVNVPTSLTAMVDSSIGGKVGINLNIAKNMVGSFYQPYFVFNDISFLQTLGEREISEGWAEAIKHAIILDPSLFKIFQNNISKVKNLDEILIKDLIIKSIQIKAKIVSEDEFEKRNRRILLNFGHTIGHALEAEGNFETYLHGEAVSIGMIGALLISKKLGLVSKEILQSISELLESYNLPIKIKNLKTQNIFNRLKHDKKMEKGSLKWVLLKDLGKTIIKQNIPETIIIDSIEKLVQK